MPPRDPGPLFVDKPAAAIVAAATAPARGQIVLAVGICALAALLAVLALLWVSGTLTRWRIERAETTAAVKSGEAATSAAESRIAAAVSEAVQDQLLQREPPVFARLEKTNDELRNAPGAGDLVHPDGFGSFMRGVCGNPARSGDAKCAGYGGNPGPAGAKPGRDAEASLPPR